MKTIEQSPRVHSQAKIEDRRLYVKTTVQDDHILENNQAHRNARSLQQGAELTLGPDGTELIYWFQVDPVLWALYGRKHPGIVRDLSSRDQVTREKAAATLARQHPEWVASSPRTRIQIPHQSPIPAP